jgi:tripartite-type tricarboxylate transporter receptor subunit TctC
MDRRSFVLSAPLLALAPLASLAPVAVRAAGPFPSRSVRIISPYAAGGGPDVQLRQAGPGLGEALGQSIVIENKVGAGGVLAAQYVAQQPADGYTLLMGSNTHLLQKILQPELHFDPLTDFAPVSNLASSPTVLVVRTDGPYRRFADLVADGKARPDQLNYGSGGVGTSAHLAGATLASLAGFKATHIPLKGSVEIAASLLRGETQFAFPVAGTAIPQINGGKLRALAVTGARRLSGLPDVPTLHELLNSDLAIQESWFGIWAPARTPPEIVLRLNAAVKTAAAQPKLKAAYEAVGNEVTPSETPKAFADFVRAENRKWTEIVRLTGVTVS